MPYETMPSGILVYVDRPTPLLETITCAGCEATAKVEIKHVGIGGGIASNGWRKYRWRCSCVKPKPWLCNECSKSGCHACGTQEEYT